MQRVQKMFLYILIICSNISYSQTTIFQDKFLKLYNYTIVTKTNINFKEYYEITITQPLDHLSPQSTFKQRIYIGFQNFDAPTVIVTDGYAIGYASKSDYSNELAQEFKANLVTVEHRFFGKSIPDSMDWKNLTVKQAAEDYHFIKNLLDTILTGKWISTGISKGGQAALAYKLFYPKDVVATVVYGTAVKNKKTIVTDSLLFNLSQSVCGQKVSALQLFCFKHKSNLLPLFNGFCFQKNFDFKPLENEAVLDYLLLELPFSFWQNGSKCEEIPDTTASSEELATYIIKVVPPQFFSVKNKMQLESAFYMLYHELGYYEYNLQPFKSYLKQTEYLNSYFAPPTVSIQFDNTYQKSIVEFFESKASDTIYFIYGQNDPWALQTTIKKNRFIIKEGNHKSRIANLDDKQRLIIYSSIKSIIK